MPRRSSRQASRRFIRCDEHSSHHGMVVPPKSALVTLAQQSVRSGRALAGRATSLQILCDQLDHTRANLARLESELGRLIASDPAVKGLSQVQEFGLKTVAVLRAELGDVRAFAARIRPLPTGVWISRSKKVVSGKGRLSSPNGAAGCSDSPLPGCLAQHSHGRLRFWGLLSSLGGTWTQERLGADGGDA